MKELLETLRQFDALRDRPAEGKGDAVEIRQLDPQPPQVAAPEEMAKLPPVIRKALEGLGIESLYAHQVQAIDCLRSGADAVLEAPTASGKTLAFNIPVILRLLEDEEAHALMIHPMKALSNDQRRQFEQLAQAVHQAGGRRLESWIYDGDQEDEIRKLLRSNPPPMLFTNPEMLHQSFLGWNGYWERYLRRLKVVVLDEIHEYRGFFGTNVALLLRRFFARLARMGVHPQVILATATCGNAQEHAQRLTGRACTLLRCDQAARPLRHFAFINPEIPDFQYAEIYRLRIVKAALACLARGLNTLIFCPSRRFAEEAAIRAQREAPQHGLDPETIAPYRSGYEAELRRSIEEGLRTGRYRAVFSTNALEIGVDIGRLDVCILAGFPDSSFSAWQRIGRVGRRWDKPAYVLFYAMNHPFDRFLAGNIDAFLEKPLDEILIGVDNEELMERHLPYLVHESEGELPPSLATPLGQPFYDFARRSLEGKKPVRNRKPNYQRLNIRGACGSTYKLIYKGKEIGDISDVHLFREAYKGAIYHHFGKSYRVVSHGEDEVELEDADPHLRTEGRFYTVMHEAEMLHGVRFDERLATCYGRLTLYENFAGYRLIDTRLGEVVDEQDSNESRHRKVRGFWLEIDPACLPEPEQRLGWLGIEHLLRIGAPFVVPCDRHDLSTWTNGQSPPTVYLYETVPGGIGIAEKTLEVWPTILRTAIEIAQRCRCKHGCPRCLVPPRLREGSEEPKKAPTIAAAQHLLSLLESGSRERYDPSTHAWMPWPRA